MDLINTNKSELLNKYNLIDAKKPTSHIRRPPGGEAILRKNIQK